MYCGVECGDVVEFPVTAYLKHAYGRKTKPPKSLLELPLEAPRADAGINYMQVWHVLTSCLTVKSWWLLRCYIIIRPILIIVFLMIICIQ